MSDEWPPKPFTEAEIESMRKAWPRYSARHGDDKTPTFLGDAPDDLAVVLRYASERRVDWLMLDCDGDVAEGLPTYDWEATP
jgi:hypothetical protein